MSSAGNAEHQLGPTHRGWYSRGYLPHCDHPGIVQSITYHLADSLPAAVLEQINAELRTLPPERQDSERRRRVEAWLAAGHGSCVLRLPEAAACVVDTWRHFARERYDLIAWVVMPNHVHVVGAGVRGGPASEDCTVLEELYSPADSCPDGGRPSRGSAAPGSKGMDAGVLGSIHPR